MRKISKWEWAVIFFVLLLMWLPFSLRSQAPGTNTWSTTSDHPDGPRFKRVETVKDDNGITFYIYENKAGGGTIVCAVNPGNGMYCWPDQED